MTYEMKILYLKITHGASMAYKSSKETIKRKSNSALKINKEVSACLLTSTYNQSSVYQTLKFCIVTNDSDFLTRSQQSTNRNFFHYLKSYCEVG